MARVVLTGAGFSKDFGGMLAKEIREELLNQSSLACQSRIYGLLSGAANDNKDGNYELVLSRLERKGSEDVDLNMFLTGLHEVFTEMDQSILSRVGIRKDSYSCTLRNLFQFLSEWMLADGACDQGNYVFTLNQDLLIERFWDMPLTRRTRYFGIGEPSIPNHRAKDIFHNKVTCPATELDFAVEPSETIGGRDDCHYVKIHGSMNWLRSDGTRLMISGINKFSKIGSDRVLAGIWECFRSQCLQDRVKILCIGYGFGDGHVNSVIANALADHCAELVIISPDAWGSRKKMTEATAMKVQFKNQEVMNDIHKRIRHYDGNILHYFFAGSSNYGHYGRLAKELRRS